ncbi:hypothetical protein, partial [Cronobacter sakazakii]|uniref:hypothetical protein n=1 Tax=Cronobacter sakazakii TaxID=28141 RepID=UPI001FED67DB
WPHRRAETMRIPDLQRHSLSPCLSHFLDAVACTLRAAAFLFSKKQCRFYAAKGKMVNKL